MEFQKIGINHWEYDFQVKSVINGSTYVITFIPNGHSKCVRTYISIGSGVKRKGLLESSLDKTVKSKGGIEVLVWYKECVRQFIKQSPQLLKHYQGSESIYVIVEWENNRLRDIYQRFLKDLGFYVTNDLGTKCLKLKVK